MRATESVIRLYYREVIGSEPTDRNWGAYIRDLRTKGVDAKIVDPIDHLRDLHRNPLMHPEVVLTEDEAFTLVGMAQGIIVAMTGDIVARRASKTLALPASVS